MNFEVLYDEGIWQLIGDHPYGNDVMENYEDEQLEIVGHIYEEQVEEKK